MGWILMLSVGALFSGLFLGFRDLVPYMAARRSGVIRRKGARDVRVRRDDDPEGFARLLANRSKSAAIGFGWSVAGLLVLSLFCVAITGTGGPVAIVVFIADIGVAIFATVCLIRGMATGRMFAFWSIALFGEAVRKQNPTWFWTYAALNLLAVLGGIATVWQALGG